MAAIVVAAFGLSLYSIAVYVSPVFAVAIVLILVATLVPFIVAGVVVGANNPLMSALLMQGWSLLVLVAAGGIAAGGIYLSSLLVSGDEASTREKAIIGAAGALAALVVSGFGGWLEGRLAPWFCFSVVRRKYWPMFPCTPVSLGPGRAAQELISKQCRSFSADQWSIGSVRELLRKVAGAIAAGEVHGGPNWKCI